MKCFFSLFFRGIHSVALAVGGGDNVGFSRVCASIYHLFKSLGSDDNDEHI